MRSIAINLDTLVDSGRLKFYSSRPTIQNLELHFINIKKIVEELKPTAVILDPVTNLMSEGPNSGVRIMLTRFVDFLKSKQISVIFTAAITEKLIERNPSDEGISSMVDTWIMVQDAESESERKRTCTIMKSRGMGHSKMVKELILENKGISLRPITQKQGEDRQNSKEANQ
jgi:circadian clock protein KaiC